MQDSVFELVSTSLGVLSIRDKISGEIMHNPVGPWAEANELYIEQSKLKGRLSQSSGAELVIFDVGLGAATNALAVLHCARNRRVARPIHLVSFERDLSLLRFTLAHAQKFDFFAGFEVAVESILTTGEWKSESIRWSLRHGDFTELIKSEPTRADLIYFEPYSPKQNLDMWTMSNFAHVFAKCSSSGAELYTYSRATPVRVALLLAGFYVGTGLAIGAKTETTEASTRLENLSHPLGRAWLERWGRSHQQNASGAPPEMLDLIRRQIPAHPQFSGC